MESVEMNFWKNKKVFITGHTGFKGSWLCLWLDLLGADVYGYALAPPTKPSLYELCKIDRIVHSVIADVRDYDKLERAIKGAKPEIIIHMAAQPIVRESYKVPRETYEINVIGTVNLLEAARQCKSVKVIINVTTDKVYENVNKQSGYKEKEALGGYDPYSSSKACSELAAAAYRRSYGMNLATARAGNVIGGGDWAYDRLVPDFVRAILCGKKLRIRNPFAIRPWQHVLEPLSGYLLLAEKLYKYGNKYAQAWNFGPNDSDAKPVKWIADNFCKNWGKEAGYIIDRGKHPHEAHLLKLDSSKARKILGWRPKWKLEMALDKVIEWIRAYKENDNLVEICHKQIKEHMV